ncbi:hypothetical protein D3C76_1656820 [compost metagenome]
MTDTLGIILHKVRVFFQLAAAKLMGVWSKVSQYKSVILKTQFPSDQGGDGVMHDSGADFPHFLRLSVIP